MTIDIKFLIKSMSGLNKNSTPHKKQKTLSKDSFEHFGHPKLLWNCFIWDMGRLFLFLLSFCDLLLWEFTIFCNILKRFYSGFFTFNFPILATNNDGIQHSDSLHIQITFDPFSFIRISAKSLVKDGHHSLLNSFWCDWKWLFFISGPEGHK